MGASHGFQPSMHRQGYRVSKPQMQLKVDSDNPGLWFPLAAVALVLATLHVISLLLLYPAFPSP